MKNALTLLAAFLFAPLLALCAAADKPNILYILADDLGYNDVGFNGCKEIKTPNVDKLAHDGTILQSFYAQPLCSTSRASLLTGRYPCHMGKTLARNVIWLPRIPKRSSSLKPDMMR